MNVECGLEAVVGRGTPRERRARRRAEVVDAASGIFATRGYHATCMDEICECAGISKPVLYKYFSSKLDLYLAVLQKHIDELVASVRQALRSSVDNKSRVHAAVGAYFDFVDHETQVYRLVFESDLTSEPSVQWRVLQGTEACIVAVSDAIARDSGLDDYRTRALAVGLVGASRFAAQYWLEAGRPISKEEAVAATADLCWGGISHVPYRRSETS